MARRSPMRNLTDMVQLKLRFQEQLRRGLEREAHKAGRSLNGEIVHRLTHSFQQQFQHEIVTAAIKQAVQETVRETLRQLRSEHHVLGFNAMPFEASHASPSDD